MPQTKYDVPIADKAHADEIIKKTETSKGSSLSMLTLMAPSL